MKRKNISDREPGRKERSPEGINRRTFLTGLGSTAGASLALSILPPFAGDAQARHRRPGGSSVVEENARLRAAQRIREKAANLAAHLGMPRQRSNGEEQDYPFVAAFTKGLPHNELGEVDPRAFKLLKKALERGDPQDFEAIPLGGKKLKNPLAGRAFTLAGGDSHQFFMPPAPRIDGPENSSEMAEVYWHALCRDINFSDYGTDPLISDACNDLTKFSNFRGPKDGGVVTPATLFRGTAEGNLPGPYIAQFLYKDIPFSTLLTTQAQATVVPSVDFLTRYNLWLHRQNGRRDGNVDLIDPVRRYIRNGRDLAAYVHNDVQPQAVLNAAFILIGLQAPLDSGNPYTGFLSMDPFSTFGDPHLVGLVTKVAALALQGVWFQKWWVHRRLRPETFSGRIHNHILGRASYPIDSEILNSAVLDLIFNYNASQNSGTSDGGTYLLPQAYPEGSPLHPAYGSGHATVAGACVTILKAWFDESFVIPDPLVPNSDGTALEPYSGADAGQLTLGGELNKLAFNIGIGRNFAGIHWRTDALEGIKLGEAIAIQLLKEENLLYAERNSFQLTKFDGTTITIR